MSFPFTHRSRRNRQGAALVIALLMLVLIALLVVALSTSMTSERVTAHACLERQSADALAGIARDHAVALLRDGIEAGRAPGKFWVDQPGMISVFNGDGTAVSTTALSSGVDTTVPMVDLNQQTFSGNIPIASGSPAPVMQVDWINVQQDPSTSASANNPVVGRYAFWVDDESSKVNINTADGTSKTNAPPLWSDSPSTTPVTFGAGMPTEVDLAALKNMTFASATNIARATGVRSGTAFPRFFNDVRESLQTLVPPATYQDNNFNLTHYSRAPELNIFGEPKIYLMTAGLNSTLESSLNSMIGPYPTPDGNDVQAPGLPLKQVYPNSNPYAYVPNISQLPNTSGVGNQLPPFVVNSALSTNVVLPAANTSLPQYFSYQSSLNQPFGTGDTEYDMGLRIAQYLKGYNSQGNPITWPTFPGSSTTGFSGKYTDRQIDSITLQILDVMRKGTMTDSSRSFTVPYIMDKGFLSGQMVKGLSRGPHPDQVLMGITTYPGDPPQVGIQIFVQWYFPKEYKGYNLAPPYSGGDGIVPGRAMNGYNIFCYNTQDCPPQTLVAPGVNGAAGPSVLGGWWADNLLTITAQDGLPAGVDLYGNRGDRLDPDQGKASLYHPYEVQPDGTYLGSGANVPLFTTKIILDSPAPPWNVGDYHDSANLGEGVSYPMRQTSAAHPFAPITSIYLKGGIAIWASDFAGTPSIDPTPLESFHGPYTTGEDLSDPTLRSTVLNAVVPIPANSPQGLKVDVDPNDQKSVWVVMKVADPLVNNFPGDWVGQVITDWDDERTPDKTTSPEVSLTAPPFAHGPSVYSNGASLEFRAVGGGTPDPSGGDPSAYWMPEMNQNIPKSQRFPSVGYLQYIRTGLMPDPANDPNDSRHVTGTTVKGTPFRLLDFAPSTDPSQMTVGGASYPDWAMLDLFTVPVSPQPLGNPLPSYLEMTFGGSTPGRVNVNNPGTLAPFASGVSRTSPLNAVFKDLQVSNSYTGGGVDVAETPVITTIDDTTAQSLTQSISDYIASNNRPLLMPSEIANVPAVANYVYRGNLLPASQSRNDLVREVVGNLTTQSNTFSIWTRGQVIKKRPGNVNYDQVESSDLIQSDVRAHYIVERYIDLGTDGVPGNSKNPGADGMVGTPDDPIDGDDTATPPTPGTNPKMSYPLPYKYRIIFAEEINS